MLDQLTRATFEPLLGKRFVALMTEGQTVEMELIEARALPVHPGSKGPRREPFSLVFRGPRKFVLPQCIYHMEQAALGTVEIFLVPIGPDESGQRYEAIFN